MSQQPRPQGVSSTQNSASQQLEGVANLRNFWEKQALSSSSSKVQQPKQGSKQPVPKQKQEQDEEVDEDIVSSDEYTCKPHNADAEEVCC